MAQGVKFQWFGVQLYMDEPLTQTLINEVKAGGGTTVVSSALVAAIPALGTAAAAVTAIVGAIVWLAGEALTICDSAHRGIILTVLWVGLPWCTGQ